MHIHFGNQTLYMTFDLSFLKLRPSPYFHDRTFMNIQAFLSTLIYHLSVQFTGALNFVFQHFLAAGLYVPGIYVKVLGLNLQDSHKIDNFSGMLSYAAFSSKSKFIKSALAYFDNDDNNLERKEEDKSSIRTRYLWLWRKANNRCPILLCCSLNDTFIY